MRELPMTDDSSMKRYRDERIDDVEREQTDIEKADDAKSDAKERSPERDND
jgi:hypothetical protein